MSPSLFSRLVLVLSGVTALFVSLSILWDPVSFYAGYGVEAGLSPSLLNELKAPAGGILVMGTFALLGAWRPRLTLVATRLSALFYLCYGISRALSVAFDGMPSTGTLLAMGAELVLGVLCLGSLWAQRSRSIKAPS